jgi:inosose dehydratase
MTLPVTITCAPCCWGVDDVSNPHLPHWERVLDEAAEAGFGGLELGPYGYMPLVVARVGAALEARGLRIVAVMDWGHDERDYAAGHSGRAPRLGPEAWDGMVANIRAIAELARDRYGVRAYPPSRQRLHRVRG